MKARVKTQLAQYDQNRVLEEMVRKRTRELVHTQDVTILGMAVLAEYRDNETGGHIMRTQHYVRALADVYDALISKRVYKPPFPHKKAVEIITIGVKFMKRKRPLDFSKSLFYILASPRGFEPLSPA